MIFFNRDLKQHYSWLTKDTKNSINIYNSYWEMFYDYGIFSNGQFLSLVVNDTGNIDRF